MLRWGVGRDLWDGRDRGGWVFPTLRVVPMGWSWAMFLSQRVLQHQAILGAGLSFERVLVDNKAAPDLSNGEPVILPYADNLNVAGPNQDKVQAAKDGAVSRLRGLGFIVHEEMDATDVAQSPGFLIDGKRGIVSPIPERLQKVILCFKWLSRRPRVTTKSMQKLLGHAVHFMMLRRELLSIPRSLYDFIQRAGPLVGKRTASDASLSSIAVCARSALQHEVASIGGVRGSWRFRGVSPESRPRSVLRDPGDPFSDPATVKPLSVEPQDPFELNENFQELPQEFLEPSQWCQTFSQYMQFPEHITLLEGRGCCSYEA